METLAFILGVGWALIGVVGAFASGKSYLWRAGIVLGPFVWLMDSSDT